MGQLNRIHDHGTNLNEDFDQIIDESNEQDGRIRNNEGKFTFLDNKYAAEVADLQSQIDAIGGGLGGSATGAGVMKYINTAQIELPEGLEAKDETTGKKIKLSSDTTVDITVVGEGGLDQGTEIADGWYRVWMISKDDGTTSAIMSRFGNTPVLPAGYTNKAAYPLPIRNDSSSNLMPFKAVSHTRLYYSDFDYTDAKHRAYLGSSSPFIPIDLSALVPPNAVEAKLYTYRSSGSFSTSGANIRASGDAGSGMRLSDAAANSWGYGTTRYFGDEYDMPIENQEIEFSGGSTAIHVRGFSV